MKTKCWRMHFLSRLFNTSRVVRPIPESVTVTSFGDDNAEPPTKVRLQLCEAAKVLRDVRIFFSCGGGVDAKLMK